MAGGTKRYPSPYPSRSRRPKKVRFADQIAPSQITLKVVCGPADCPSLTIIVRIGFDEHHKPHLTVKFKRGSTTAPRQDKTAPQRAREQKWWEKDPWPAI